MRRCGGQSRAAGADSPATLAKKRAAVAEKKRAQLARRGAGLSQPQGRPRKADDDGSPRKVAKRHRDRAAYQQARSSSSLLEPSLLQGATTLLSLAAQFEEAAPAGSQLPPCPPPAFSPPRPAPLFSSTPPSTRSSQRSLRLHASSPSPQLLSNERALVMQQSPSPPPSTPPRQTPIAPPTPPSTRLSRCVLCFEPCHNSFTPCGARVHRACLQKQMHANDAGTHSRFR